MKIQFDLQKKLEQQNQLISFIQEQYKNETGHEIELPHKLKQAQLLVEQVQEQDESQKKSVEVMQKKVVNDSGSFMKCLENLDLPFLIGKTPKKQNRISIGRDKPQALTSFDPRKSTHLIQSIDLSHFHQRKFSKIGLRMLVDSIQEMACLSTVLLKNNGIDSTYCTELEALMNNKTVVRIDLSVNQLDATAINQLASHVIDNKLQHFQWLDMSRNYYSTSKVATTKLVQMLSTQPNLVHFAIDSNNTANENVTKLVNSIQQLKSVTFIDQTINKTGIRNIATTLRFKQNLKQLSINFCFLNYNNCLQLAKALQSNSSLVKLDLSNNGLISQYLIELLDVIKNNQFLGFINLRKNQLDDDFAEKLAETLKINDILYKVDISGNPIQKKGAEKLLNTILSYNDCLESFGNIQDCPFIGLSLVQEINTTLRNNHQAQTNPYILLQPIQFTNKTINDENNYKIWNV